VAGILRNKTDKTKQVKKKQQQKNRDGDVAY
jgi:hypothetical protein